MYKLFKYVFGVGFTLGGIAFLGKGSLGGLFFMLLGLSLIPLISEEFQKRLPFWKNAAIRRTFTVCLLMLVFFVTKIEVAKRNKIYEKEQAEAEKRRRQEEGRKMLIYEKEQAEAEKRRRREERREVLEYTKAVSKAVSARKLYADYEANEISADNKYKGRKLAVTGVIKDIGNNWLNQSYITLGRTIFGIQCYLDKKIVANLRKGQRVTVIGKCTGLMVTIGLDDCEILQ